MSLQPQSIADVPLQTAKVAGVAFRQGNRDMMMRDRVGEFYEDLDFVDLCAVQGRPGETTWRLALVVVFQ